MRLFVSICEWKGEAAAISFSQGTEKELSRRQFFQSYASSSISASSSTVPSGRVKRDASYSVWST